MAFPNILETDNFDQWLTAFNANVDLFNEILNPSVDGNKDYIADTAAITVNLRDKLEAILNINNAGIFADPATDHAYVGQFFDENATFDAAVADNDLVYIHTDGKYYQAKGDSDTTSNVVGIADKTNGKVICSGLVQAGIAVAANEKIFLSDTVAGDITDTETPISVGLSLGSGLILLGTVGGSGGASSQFNIFRYTATASQTTFTGADDNTNTLSYVQDKVQVFINGILVDSDNFTATSGTSIVLDTGAEVGDLLEIYCWSATSAGTITAIQNNYIIQSTNERLITNSQIKAGNTIVSLNGLKLTRGISYTDTSGSITLDNSISTAIGDVVDLHIFTYVTNTYTGAITSLDDTPGSYGSNAGQNARVNSDGDGIVFGNGWTLLEDNYVMDTTGLLIKIFLDSGTQSFGITLPGTPNNGTEIEFIDIGSNLATNNVTLSRNGKNIEGSADNLVLDVDDIKLKIVYETTYGWKIINYGV